MLKIFSKGYTMFKAGKASVESQEQLVSDIKSVISEAEEMLGATAEQAGSGVAANRRRFWAELHAGQQLAEEAASRAGRGSTPKGS